MGLNILVAEDSKDLAESYKIILQERGHSVMVTADGIECLQAYRDSLKHGKETGLNFDVILLDQHMPGMSGVNVAKAIQQLNPQQRIIFLTGWGNEVVKSLNDINENIEIMNKPFHLQSLISQLEGKTRHMGDKQTSEGFKRWDGHSGTSTPEGSKKIVVEAIKSAKREAEESNEPVPIQEAIQKIAGQMNFLALNVAIEAVRVRDGETGSIGFAKEVKKLAEGSAIASEEINGLIKDKKKTQTTVTNTER